MPGPDRAGRDDEAPRPPADAASPGHLPAGSGQLGRLDLADAGTIDRLSVLLAGTGDPIRAASMVSGTVRQASALGVFNTADRNERIGERVDLDAADTAPLFERCVASQPGWDAIGFDALASVLGTCGRRALVQDVAQTSRR